MNSAESTSKENPVYSKSRALSSIIDLEVNMEATYNYTETEAASRVLKLNRFSVVFTIGY